MTSLRARFAARLALCGLLAPILPNCDNDASRCVPGQSIVCEGNGCSGHQICRADGRAYEDCTCDGTNEEFPTAGPNSGLIGAACNGDRDCRLGLECVRSDSTLVAGEGPSAGMCLARCLPDHDFCQGLDALARCVVLDDAGTSTDALDDVAYCMPGCNGGAQANEADKCRGRIDLACTAVTEGSKSGYCRPACRGDIDCGARHCNLSTGLCGDIEPTGDPIGTFCDPDATTTTCSGGCMSHETSYSECSGVCRIGGPGCGNDTAAPDLAYYCVHPAQAGAEEGDLGYCAKLCDCDGDCERQDAVCEPTADLQSLAGRLGVCGSKLLASGKTRTNAPCQ